MVRLFRISLEMLSVLAYFGIFLNSLSLRLEVTLVLSFEEMETKFEFLLLESCFLSEEVLMDLSD